MKIAAAVAGALLGLLFIVFSSMVLFHLVAVPAPKDDGSLSYHFMIAFANSGWLTLVKSCELVGGILVAIPLTRNLGLLVLGPIIINIFAYHALVEGPATLANPVLIVIALLAAFLLFAERKAFAGLVRR